MTDLLDIRAGESDDKTFTTCWEVTACPRSDFMACSAYQQRKNCYELDRVVCCVKHRDNCPACPVYIALNKVPVQKIRMRVCTDRFDVAGTLHVPTGSRLSDFLNKPERRYLIITDAVITPIDQPSHTFENPFVAVSKSHVVLVHPLDGS